uniref:Uncharacterized protein n=1 Tax=Anguilla anguilla TaxID=7936 RepID=A0A0E9V9W5_ANGAN
MSHNPNQVESNYRYIFTFPYSVHMKCLRYKSRGAVREGVG